MRLCAIDAAGTTTYEDDPGFALDGSAGDVFVEIPKHYVRREVKDGVEYAAISATRGRALSSIQASAGQMERWIRSMWRRT